MNALWEHFDAIFCINIIERKDRYVSSKKEFDKINVPIQYHFVTRCENGERGCFESHTAICKKALENNYRRIIIFEDDLEVCDNFTTDTSRKILQFLLSVKWKMFYLGCFPINRYHSYATQYNSIYKVRAVGTHAYAINRSQIEYIASMRWENKPYDSYFTAKYHYAYLPTLFMQKAVKSDIERNINIINNFPLLKYTGLYINERYTMYVGQPISQISVLIVILLILVAIILIQRRNRK